MREIQVYDIVRVMLTPDRRAALQSGSDLCRRLAQADGMQLQVTGIRKSQEPESSRAFSLSPLSGKSNAAEFVFASRADIVFIKEGAASAGNKVNAEKIPDGKAGKQEELF